MKIRKPIFCVCFPFSKSFDQDTVVEHDQLYQTECSLVEPMLPTLFYVCGPCYKATTVKGTFDHGFFYQDSLATGRAR